MSVASSLKKHNVFLNVGALAQKKPHDVVCSGLKPFMTKSHFVPKRGETVESNLVTWIGLPSSGALAIPRLDPEDHLLETSRN